MIELPSPEVSNEWMIELTEDERIALPASYHRPYFDGLSTPWSWICAACWGDDYSTKWPCDIAVNGGVELAKSLQVGYSW